MVQIDWPADFGEWLDRLDAKSRKGDPHATQTLALAAAALKHLRDLDEAPTRDHETATLKMVWHSSRATRRGSVMCSTTVWAHGPTRSSTNGSAK